MVSILSHFNHKLGPIVYKTYPTNVEITEEVDNIAKELDNNHDEGLFYKKDVIRTISHLFYIESKYARGGLEVLLLSCIITETIPDEAVYENRLIQAVEEFKKDKDIYKAFHPSINGHKEALVRLMIILKKLDKEVRSKTTSTIGYMSRGDDIYEHHFLPIHPTVKQNEEQIKKARSKTFLIIYKENDDGSFSIKGFEVNSDKLYKLEIFTDTVDMWMLKKVTEGFKEKLRAKIITTSGICQQSDVCTFEIYFEYNEEYKNIKDFQLYLKNIIPSKSKLYPIVDCSVVEYGFSNLKGNLVGT